MNEGNQINNEEPISKQEEVKEEIEVNTNKEKNNNLTFFLFLFILLMLTFFIDSIIDYLSLNSKYDYITGLSSIKSSGTLNNSFIEINNKNSFITMKDIKFYNFKKINNELLSFDYVLNNINDDIDEIYIELYDADLKLIYKEMFNPLVSPLIDVSYQYSIKINEKIIEPKYAKITIYTKEESNKRDVVVCTYKETKEDYIVSYKNIYNFINNELFQYEVSKEILLNNGNLTYYDIFKSETEELNKYNIKNSIINNKLMYKVDVRENNEYNYLYSKGTVPYIIIKNETLKKWNCE